MTNDANEHIPQESAVMNGAGMSHAPAAPEGTRTFDPAVLAQVAEVRMRLQAGIGEAVVAMANLPRYRNQAVADLLHLVVEPMIRDRIAIARTAADGRLEETAGFAIWATVSQEVDAKIREQIAARVFPLRLKAEDWTSGDIHWLFDVIAPSQKVSTAVLMNFRQVVKDKPVRLHPLVKQLVDPDVLERMRMRDHADVPTTDVQ